MNQKNQRRSASPHRRDGAPWGERAGPCMGAPWFRLRRKSPKTLKNQNSHTGTSLPCAQKLMYCNDMYLLHEAVHVGLSDPDVLLRVSHCPEGFIPGLVGLQLRADVLHLPWGGVGVEVVGRSAITRKKRWQKKNASDNKRTDGIFRRIFRTTRWNKKRLRRHNGKQLLSRPRKWLTMLIYRSTLPTKGRNINLRFSPGRTHVSLPRRTTACLHKY